MLKSQGKKVFEWTGRLTPWSLHGVICTYACGKYFVLCVLLSKVFLPALQTPQHPILTFSACTGLYINQYGIKKKTCMKRAWLAYPICRHLNPHLYTSLHPTVQQCCVVQSLTPPPPPYTPRTFNTPILRGPPSPFSAHADYLDPQSQTVPFTLLGSVSHGPLPRSLLQRAHGFSTTDLF